MNEETKMNLEKLDRLQQERKELWKSAWYECGRLLDNNKTFTDNYDQMVNTRVRIGFADVTLMAFDKRFYDNGKYLETLPKFIQNYYMKEVYYKDICDKFTNREKQIMELLSGEYSITHIASILDVSKSYIATTIRKLKKKCQVETTEDLMELAIKLK